MKNKGKIVILSIIIFEILFFYKFIFLKYLDIHSLKRKNIVKNQNLKKIEKDIEKLYLLKKDLKIKKIQQEKKEKDFFKNDQNFLSTGDFIFYINNLCVKNNLKLILVGRETSLDENENRRKVYLEILGDEKKLFSFFKYIDKSRKYLNISKNNFSIEAKGNLLLFRGEFVYMLNNKINNHNFKHRKSQIFKERKERIISEVREGF